MLRFYGVTELAGPPGSGRTAICMDEARRYRTAYVATAPLCTQRYADASAETMDRIFVESVSSIEALASFAMHSLERLVVARDIELVVVDSLDHLLAAEERSSRMHSLVESIVRRLKRMNQKHGVHVLVVTCHYGGWVVGLFCIGNPTLGLGWMYMVNTRYVCERRGDERMLRLVHSPMNDEQEWVFSIGPCRVSYG